MFSVNFIFVSPISFPSKPYQVGVGDETPKLQNKQLLRFGAFQNSVSCSTFLPVVVYLFL